MPIEKYTKLQGRYSHLTSQQIREIQERVDQKWEWLKWLAEFKNRSK